MFRLVVNVEIRRPSSRRRVWAASMRRWANPRPQTDGCEQTPATPPTSSTPLAKRTGNRNGTTCARTRPRSSAYRANSFRYRRSLDRTRPIVASSHALPNATRLSRNASTGSISSYVRTFMVRQPRGEGDLNPRAQSARGLRAAEPLSNPAPYQARRSPQARPIEDRAINAFGARPLLVSDAAVHWRESAKRNPAPRWTVAEDN